MLYSFPYDVISSYNMTPNNLDACLLIGYLFTIHAAFKVVSCPLGGTIQLSIIFSLKFEVLGIVMTTTTTTITTCEYIFLLIADC